MKRKRTFKAPHRRRAEQKTDYRRRLGLLKSGKPRLVVRGSANSITCQLVEHSQKGDRTVVTVNCASLKKMGWKGHGGNMPSAYLVGLLCGNEAKKKGLKSAVLDTGSHKKRAQTRVYAALRGVVDSGLDIPHSPEALPPEGRVTGKHVSEYAGKLKKDDPGAYKRRFSAYLKGQLVPEELEKHFADLKKKIAS